MNKLLFLCSGNYYRSRFAEDYFNHLAEQIGLEWRAFSKGLSENMPSANNPGPISIHAIQALHDRNVTSENLKRYPRKVDPDDFTNHDMIIALSKDEHEPMLRKRFSDHLDKITYFEVGDLPLEEPSSAMNKLSLLLDDLVSKLNR